MLAGLGTPQDQPKKSWIKWPGRGKSGFPWLGCCPWDPIPDKQGLLFNWIVDWALNINIFPNKIIVFISKEFSFRSPNITLKGTSLKQMLSVFNQFWILVPKPAMYGQLKNKCLWSSSSPLQNYWWLSYFENIKLLFSCNNFVKYLQLKNSGITINWCFINYSKTLLPGYQYIDCVFQIGI